MRRALLVGLGLLLGALTPATASARVVGGRPISITAAPWQVDVWSENSGSVSDCGGAILDASTILTAAHCVEGATPGAAPSKGGLGVWAGTSSISSRTASIYDRANLQERRVASARVHPMWRHRVATSGDLAVLRLAEPLHLDGRRTAAIALPGALPVPVAEPFAVGPDLTVSGYGLNAGGGSTDGRLRQLALRVVDPDVCDDTDNAIELCASTPAGSACSGDSGGPVVAATAAGPVLVGVVSNGPRACPPGGANRYVSLVVPENRAFVLGSDSPPMAPRRGEPAQFTAGGAAPRIGSTVTCDGGSFTGRASQRTVITADGGVLLLATGAAATIQVTADLVGRQLRCRSYGSNAGGIAVSNIVTAGAPVRDPWTAPSAASCPAQPRSVPLVVSAPDRARRGSRISLSATIDEPSPGARVAVLRVRRTVPGAGTVRRVRTLPSRASTDLRKPAMVRVTYRLPASLAPGATATFQLVLATYRSRTAADRSDGLRAACDSGDATIRVRITR